MPLEGFTIIDGIVAFVILLSAILAYARGFVRELLAIGAWIAAAILAFIFADDVEPLFRQIPVVGDFLGDSCELALIAAFAGVFALTLVVVSIFTPLFSAVVQRSALGGLDQGMGFIFGALRGILLVAVAYFVYDVVLVNQDVAMVDESRSAAIFGAMTERFEDSNPEDALGWVTAQYEELVSSCDAPGGSDT